MKVTSIINSTMLEKGKEYEVIKKSSNSKSEFYCVMTETGVENYINAKSFEKVERKMDIYIFGDETIEYDYLGDVNPFERVGKDDE